MAGKNLGAAKQYREETLCKFKLACEDLSDEVDPEGSAEPNVYNCLYYFRVASSFHISINVDSTWRSRQDDKSEAQVWG